MSNADVARVLVDLADLLEIQVVALPSNPMTGPEGRVNRDALDAAIEIGVDLIGGCPHLDPDGPGLIAHSLAVATEAGIGLDLHVDEMLDPKVRRLPFRSRLVRATARVVTHVRLSRKYSSGEVSSKVPPACSKRSSKVRVLLSKLNTPEPERCDSP